MKLSNKILIGFFAFIFLYLTAVFAEIRLRGTPNFIDDANSRTETVDIPGVGYLVVNDLQVDIHVIGSGQPRLEVRSVSGDMLKGLTHKVSGDTLMLSKMDSKDQRPIRVLVFVPQSGFKGLRVNNAVAFVSSLHQELLTISQHAGRVTVSDSKIRNVNLEASHRSQLDISTTDLDTVSLTIDASQVFLSSPLSLLKGSMRNNSFVRVANIEEIQFRKDESSRLNMYQ
jgi:hypothetical protein